MQKSTLKLKIKNWLKIVLIPIVIGIIVSILYFKIDLLNQKSGAVIAIFTGFYVIGTLFMWWELRKSRLRLDKPNIQISFEPQKRWGNFFDLVVKNLGNVPVYDLEFKIEPSNLKTLGKRKLEDLNLFKRSIPVFGVGEELKTFAIAYVDFINSDQPKQFSVTARYKTKDGRPVSEKYNFDMEIYKGMSAFSEKSLNEVVEQLEKLNEILKEITRK